MAHAHLASETIEFGPYSGRAIGSKYLVFLVSAEHQFNPMTSTNSFDRSARAEQNAACGEVYPDLREMHSGMATLDISWTSQFNYEEAVRFPDDFVATPKGVKKKKAEPGDDQLLSEAYWVKLDRAIKHLRKVVGALD